jgi:hypothetical protein
MKVVTVARLKMRIGEVANGRDAETERGKSARLVEDTQRQVTRVNEAKVRPRRILDNLRAPATDFFPSKPRRYNQHRPSPTLIQIHQSSRC